MVQNHLNTPDSPSVNEIEAPFICLNRESLSSPIILSAPHGGTDYMQYLSHETDRAAMRSLEDSGTTEIAKLAAADNRPTIIATCPRAIIDLNRPKDALDPLLVPDAPPPENNRWQRHIQAGYGIIPRVSADKHPLYRHPPAPSELLARIDRIHTPYHSVLESWIEKIATSYNRPMLIDIHSMPEAGLNQKPLPNIVFGDLHGITLPHDLKLHIDRFMELTPFSWGWNHPFAGGYITQHYGTGEKAISTLQIEVNRGLFLGHSRLDLDALTRLADCVKSLVTSLSDKLANDIDRQA